MRDNSDVIEHRQETQVDGVREGEEEVPGAVADQESDPCGQPERLRAAIEYIENLFVGAFRALLGALILAALLRRRQQPAAAAPRGTNPAWTGGQALERTTGVEPEEASTDS